MHREQFEERAERESRRLLDQNAAEWKSLELRRLDFVKTYPLSRIPSLTLDEYVCGKRGSTFCNRIERELAGLGGMRGATALKFGVYYGHKKGEPTTRYWHADKWGDGVKAAFIAVKQEIVALLRAAARDDWTALKENHLSTMFRGKLLHLYFPNKFLSVYSTAHLRHFLVNMDLLTLSHHPLDMQNALMECRGSMEPLKGKPAPLWPALLYQWFGYPPGEDAASRQRGVPLLSEALEGVETVDDLPKGKAVEEERTPGRGVGKPDYDGDARNRRRIGDRGEALVLEMEKRRLRQAARYDLAGRVTHASRDSDGLGYDILSFDEDGRERYIEVKATGAPDLGRGFFMTDNERVVACTLYNHYVYFVFNALSASPRVHQIKGERLAGSEFNFKPIQYRVMVH